MPPVPIQRDPEKAPLLEEDHSIDETEGTMPARPANRFARRILITFILLLQIYIWAPLCHETYRKHSRHMNHHTTQRVALEAHIMSKCPDARDCLRDLIVPVMSRVSPHVDFALSYIGRDDPEQGVLCKHGPTECLGNIIELCAADIYPDPKLYLGFTNCLTLQYIKIPEEGLVKHCAMEHGLDFDKLNHCASRDDGSYGQDLLKSSIQRTADANVTLSCTVRLEGETRCIRDGGEWKDCEGGAKVGTLVKEIEKIYKKKNART